MIKLDMRTPPVDTSHWAYQQGRIAGIAGNTSERGLMAFGLACAADAATARNTRLWLQGFDAGVDSKDEASLESRKVSPALRDDGTRHYGRHCSA